MKELFRLFLETTPGILVTMVVVIVTAALLVMHEENKAHKENSGR